MIVGVTTSDLKHCGKISDKREELNRSVTERRSASRLFIKNLKGIG